MQHICILGAGPVGSSLGVMLRRMGCAVDIFERYPDIRTVPPPAGRSINLVLTKRGLRLAEELGVATRLLEKTVRVSGRTMHSVDGKMVYQPYGRSDECNYSIDRSLLNKFWLSEAEKSGCKLYFGHRATDLDVSSGFIRMLDLDGAETVVYLGKYSAVFASDGGGSIIRTTLMKSGLLSATETLLPTCYKEVVFPALPDGGYSMDPNSLHIWARQTHMLMALANTDGSFTGTIYLDHEADDHPSFESVCSSPQKALDYFEAYFPDALELMDREITANNFITFKEGILGTVRCSPWAVEVNSTPICLIGDAAHAIVPFFGQGVNCGMEDVLVLSETLRGSCATDLKAKIFRFSESRKIDSDAIADLALDNFEEMRSRVADPEFIMLKKLDAFIMDLFPSKYRTRYTLVMYSSNPYSVCQSFGEVQRRFLQQVAHRFSISQENCDFACIDKNQLDAMLEEFISPVARSLGVSFSF